MVKFWKNSELKSESDKNRRDFSAELTAASETGSKYRPGITKAKNRGKRKSNKYGR